MPVHDFQSKLKRSPCWLILLSVTHLAAADVAWKDKPAAQWTKADAEQILSASPWVKAVTGIISRRLAEDQLREAGQMGQPSGVGYDGVDPKGSGPNVSLNVFTGAGGDDRSRRSLSRPTKLRVRWESALPVRLAEMKSPEFATPVLQGDGYQIAVYGIPGSAVGGDSKKLGEPLKKGAVLRREGKRDAKADSVEVFQLDDGIAAVYLFPLSAEIGTTDSVVLFEAHIGRVFVSQTFEVREMEFLGKLEL